MDIPIERRDVIFMLAYMTFWPVFRDFVQGMMLGLLS